MNSQEFRAAAHAAIDEIIDYYETIDDRRVISNVEPGYLRKLLPSGPPEEGEKWADIQKDIESKIMPGLTHWQSPNFMAYFPASSTYPGILGEMYSAAFTAPAFNWLCSPAVTELETIVLDWLAGMLNLPSCYLSEGEGGGVIQGSASEAAATTMIAARERYLSKACAGLEGEEKMKRRAEVAGRLVALGTTQTHSLTAKGAAIVGTRTSAIPVSFEEDLALTGARLRAKLEEFRIEGLEPYHLTVTLGTTGTCATDRFAEVKDVLKDYPDIWVHVDAAYAGAALVCEEFYHLTEAMDAFDSFDMNMHKWLLTNFDASCLYVKNRRDLTSALSITPSYLQNSASASGLVTDYRDWQIPLGRRFRSLKIWFILRTYGVSGLKAHIRNHLRLGDIFANWIRSRPDLFRIVTPPAYALTVIAIVPKGVNSNVRLTNGDGETMPEVADGLVNSGKAIADTGADDEMVKRANEVTKKVYDLINERGEIFLTSNVVLGISTIRIVSANPKADEQHLRKAFDILVSTAEEVLGEA
ncbi:hypothetical protein MMC25_002434 [Agyrium rufum]|nr:hypothetical protein [Agyrium rufum]